jgi:GH25 family lysozyme M1 (1,4-beta-N-acetylmuramidase)
VNGLINSVKARRKKRKQWRKIMKKRLLSLVLALIMTVTFCIPAFAAGINEDGTLQLDMSSTLLSLNVGDTSQISASLMGCAADVTWSSSNSSVATVDSNGSVTAVGFGRTNITAKTIDGSYGVCTVQVAYRGIDVSRHQGNIDWNAVKASGINFAFMKATEGVDYTDPNYTTNAQGASAAGINIGAYHFLRAGDVQKQASQFIDALKPFQWNYPIVVDVEHAELVPLGKNAITDMVVQFCEAIKAAGYIPMIYANPNWCSNYLDMSRLSGYDLWLAHYNVDSPSSNYPYTVWQYTSTGSVPGIGGNVDLNFSYINYPADGRGNPSANTLQCDTGSPYRFGSNNTYVYKITTSLPTAPNAVSSNPSAVAVAYIGKTSGGYLYRITNVNAGTAVITTTASNGTSASITAYGRASGLVSDTPSAINMQRGKTYQFKFTPIGTTGVPKFTSANGSVVSPVQMVKSGSSYLFKVKANGKGVVGIYSTLPNQQSVRQCVITVN